MRGKEQCAIRGNFCNIDKPALSNNEFGITGHSKFCLPAPELLFLEFHGDEPCVLCLGKVIPASSCYSSRNSLPANLQGTPKIPIPEGLGLAPGRCCGVEIQLIPLDLHPQGMENTAPRRDWAISWQRSEQGIVFISDHVGNEGPESQRVLTGKQHEILIQGKES